MISLEELYLDKNLETYYNLLIEWNKRFNLTAITSREDVYLKHFFDSLLPLRHFSSAGRVLDIGAGAGLPSIPLKLYLPDSDFVLIDSVNKKVGFLNEVISVLNLQKIRAVHGRIEDFSQRDFDIVTARAVAPLNTLAEYALPFVKLGGLFVAYKGPDTQLQEAKNAIKILGGTITDIQHFSTQNLDRNIIIITKQHPTPPIYPRSQNKPRLNPLK